MYETISLAGHEIGIRRPRSADELIRFDEFEEEERLPYWAELWPAARFLADYVSRTAPPTPEARLLELGCGVGLVTIAALFAGWSVVATDYYDDALRFCAYNAWRATLQEPVTRYVDWRAVPADLGTFDAVVASDVLYEPPNPALVAGVLAATLAPTGVAWVADPGRVHAAHFAAECVARDLVVTAEPHEKITLFVVTRSSRPGPVRLAAGPVEPGP